MDSKQKWRENNPNYQKEYYERNKEWINQKKKECRFRKKEEYAAVAKERYHTKRDEILQKDKVRRANNPKAYLITLAKARAKRNNLPFNLTVEDFEIPSHCPLLNIPLQFQNGKVGDNSPSLDKIIPELGYVKNNVWVVSIRANRLKSDSSYDELLLLVTNLRKKINAKE